MSLLPRGTKKNNKTGIASARKAEKRAEAEIRQTEYSKLSLEQKLARNSTKVKNKLMKQATAQ